MTTTDWRKHAIALEKSGMSMRKIAESLGQPKSTVSDFFRRDTKAYEHSPRTEGDHPNQRVLFISDMHIPYHHPNTLPFLQHLKDKYEPTRVICLGDELDKHALSFHDSDPDLDSAGKELEKAWPVIEDLEQMFPTMDLVDSNHGSMIYRKAKHHGLPRHYIKPYNEVLKVGPGWQWHDEMTIELPDGQKVYICHGKTVKAVRTSQLMGMSHVCGHYHESFGVEYWANPNGLFWGINSGCLIDNRSLAFAYNKINPKRPIIGTSLVIDGVPVMEAMKL